MVCVCMCVSVSMCSYMWGVEAFKVFIEILLYVVCVVMVDDYCFRNHCSEILIDSIKILARSARSQFSPAHHRTD